MPLPGLGRIVGGPAGALRANSRSFSASHRGWFAVSFAPSGLGSSSLLCPPTACAVGCILSLLWSCTDAIRGDADDVQCEAPIRDWNSQFAVCDINHGIRTDILPTSRVSQDALRLSPSAPWLGARQHHRARRGERKCRVPDPFALFAKGWDSRMLNLFSLIHPQTQFPN